ncbi:MAG: DUF192 domain-containing protein [Cyclobacteriaceae bacterium]
MTEPTSSEDKVTSVSSARKSLILILIAGVVATIIYFVILPDEENINNSVTSTTNAEVDEPAFVKEGELWFLSEENKDTIQYITIEVADDPEQRAQGMMYRTSMEEEQGMLFIHDYAEVQSYWMKNVKVPLDIIYVAENKQIVTIYQGVMPYSQKTIPSTAEALYVVEVNAGFTGRHKIEEGDFIDFEILN